MPISRLISIGTSSPWRYPRWSPSHLAMIVRTTNEVERMTGAKELWVESSTLIPRKCVLQHRHVIGIQAHLIEDRIQDYPYGKVHTFRLRETHALNDAEEYYLSQLVFSFIHQRNYDIAPANTWTSLVKKVLFKSTSVPLCSEYVQDILIHMGRSPLANPSQSSPGSFLRRHLKAGILIPEGPVLTVP